MLSESVTAFGLKEGTFAERTHASPDGSPAFATSANYEAEARPLPERGMRTLKVAPCESDRLDEDNDEDD